MMLTDYHPNWKTIITILIFLSVILFSIVLLIFNTELDKIIRSLFKLGFVILVISFLWYKFEKSWWLLPAFQGWLINTPDFRGRWVGKTTSSFDGKDRDMTLEIDQSLLRIQCVAFGLNNKGEGYSARLLSDIKNRQFTLAYLYHAKRNVQESIAGDDHEGIATLDYIPGPPKKLMGRYFNDRDPSPQKGDITLEWESYTLKGHL
jgi:SMODS-associating 2TM, beta-strand rich effector domain